MNWLIELLCKWFHLVPAEEYNKTQKELDFTMTQLEELCKKQVELNEELNKTNLVLSKYRDLWENTETQTKAEVMDENRKLKAEHDKYQKDLEEAEAYYKKVQGMIHDITVEDPIFGYRSERLFPGASIVYSRKIDSDKDMPADILVSGRTVLPDDVTARIQQVSSIQEKYQILINTLLQYRLLQRFTDELIMSGAIQFTLGYINDCTTMVAYYSLKAHPALPSLVLDQLVMENGKLKKKEDGEG